MGCEAGLQPFSGGSTRAALELKAESKAEEALKPNVHAKEDAATAPLDEQTLANFAQIASRLALLDQPTTNRIAGILSKAANSSDVKFRTLNRSNAIFMLDGVEALFEFIGFEKSMTHFILNSLTPSATARIATALQYLA